MTFALLGILLWLLVRAVRAWRGGRNGAARAGFFAVPALPIAAHPRAAWSVLVTMAVVILLAGARGRTALQTLDGLLLIAGFVALVLRLVMVPLQVGWAANVALAVAAGDFVGAVLANLLHGDN